MRIIVIDDDKDLCDLVAEAMRGVGYTVDAGRTLAQLETLLGEEDVAAVACDLTLPDGSGIAFFHHHRETLEQRGIGFLLITGYPWEDLDEQAGDSPAFAVLRKPFTLRALRTAVAELITRLRGA